MRSVIYKNASGGDVPDQGLKKLVGRATEGRRFGVKTRVGPVRRPLMAVCELCDADKEVTFTKKEAIIRDERAKKVVMKVPRVGKLWQLTMQVEPCPNGRLVHP